MAVVYSLKLEGTILLARKCSGHNLTMCSLVHKMTSPPRQDSLELVCFFPLEFSSHFPLLLLPHGGSISVIPSPITTRSTEGTSSQLFWTAVGLISDW